MTNKKRKMKSAITEESLAPLGKVIANFAVLESSLDMAIWILTIGNSLSEQRTGQIITAELSFKDKIALFSSLYQHKFPNKNPFEDLREMRKNLRAANKKRNKLIHSTWLAGGKISSTSAKEKHGIKFDFEDMTTKQIEDIADFISEIAYEITTIFTKK